MSVEFVGQVNSGKKTIYPDYKSFALLWNETELLNAITLMKKLPLYDDEG